MIIQLDETERRLVLEAIEPYYERLLRHVPTSADPGDHAGAKNRLFSAPTASEHDEPELRQDWRELVEPELAGLFRHAHQVVAADLEQLPPRVAGTTGGELTTPLGPQDFVARPQANLTITRHHAEAWLSVLNQARLVLAAKHGIGEKEMTSVPVEPPVSPVDWALVQIGFYEELQSFLIRLLGYH